MHAPAEVDHEMATGASFPQFFRSVIRGIFSLALTFLCATSLAAQSPAHSRNKASQPATDPSSFTDPSPFMEAEALLRQGSITEAKTKIQEQLQLNPSSVEGYNLLGIAYSNEQDFANALDAFQYALKLAPSSTKTLNNLGNVYAGSKFQSI